MIVEIINTGSELMLGRVLNTHQQWLCRRLSDLGYHVERQVAVEDTAPDIQAAVREALGRADLIIATGGLGPTSDDLTRDLIAKLLGKKLREDRETLRRLEAFFAVRRRPMPEGTQVQAQVPEGARVLTNNYGTAPGLAIEVRPNRFRKTRKPSWLILLPGPPRELRPMFTEVVMPLLKRVAPAGEKFVCRTMRTTGLGESQVQQRIREALQKSVDAGLDLGYCARPGEVDVRLAARGKRAAALVSAAEKIVRAELGAQIYGEEDDVLEAAVARTLIARRKTLALAESCTGGLISHRLTNVPGVSAALLAGFVTYSNAAKQKFLGVRQATLATHGAVSKATAKEMAEGARRAIGADYALSVTGIAGPDGGTKEKPVGTVFIGLASASGTLVEQHANPYDRETFKQVTSQQALDLLRRKLVAGERKSPRRNRRGR